MSRAYNARRKAKRQAQAAAEEARASRPGGSLRPRLAVLAPVLLIAAILGVVAVLGFGTGAGVSKEQVQRETAEVLDGVPQGGTVLGSDDAPITVWMFADLECPTVRLFIENYFPRFVESWVRTGVVRVGYRSLETDTSREPVFFEQEAAALAAGRQDRMWDYAMTFARQQGEPQTDYATEDFIAGIASQVPGLELSRWHRDRTDAVLAKKVALDVHYAHLHGLSATPSFLISFNNGKGNRPEDTVDWASMKAEVEATLQGNLEALQEETRADFPTVKVLEPRSTG